MKTLRILLVENDPWLGSILQDLITETVAAEIAVVSTLAAAERELLAPFFDFAFLDMAVTDGETYGIATTLLSKGTPFAFIAGPVSIEEIPELLRRAPILKKPYQVQQLKLLLGAQ